MLVLQARQHAVPGVDVGSGLLVEPGGSDVLAFRIEAHAVRPHHMQVAEEALLVAGEAEGADRHRDAHVDAHHTAVRLLGEFPRAPAAGGIDDGTVGEGVGVHDFQAFLEALDALDAQDGTEDLPCPDFHIGGHMVEDGRPDEEALLIAGHGDVAAVEDQRGPFRQALLDPVDDAFPVPGRDQGAQLGGLFPGGAEGQFLGLAGQELHEGVGDAFFHHDDRERHAAFTGAPAEGVDDAGGAAVHLAVGHDQGMVLGFAQGLHTLAGLGGLRVHLAADGARADEADAHDVGMVDEVAKAQEINFDEAVFKILNDSFLLKVSTSEGDREVDRFHLRWEEGTGLRLTFRLDESFPPVCPEKGESVPALSLLMNTEAWLFPYSWACRLEVRSVRVHVKVNGLREFSLYNELGQVDLHQPFSPFGAQGDKGAWVAFGCYEMALKPVTHVELHFRWLHLPVGNGGLEEHYREYHKGVNNRSFRARTEYLQNREWKRTYGIEEHYLFCTSSASVPVAADAVKEETKIVFEVPEVVLSPLDDITRFRPGEVRSGFYRLVLSAPDMGFGTHEYRRLFAEVMMENSHRRKKRSLPEPPLALQMDAVSLNYTAEEEVQFAVRCHSGIRFSYIRPLSGKVDTTPDITHPITLADGPEDEGNILIGIADAIGENIIRLYIGMELLQREIDHEYLPSVDWYYRDSSRWVKVDPVYVLRDDTGGLMHSGAVIIQFPFSISPEMTDTEGVFWICAGIHSNLCNCSVLRNVSLNVAEAAWTAEEEMEKSVPGLLSYRRVGLLDTTASEESETEMKARLSERIAHRQRPLLPCEYEQLVLQEFPGLAKVKCLRGIDAKSLNRTTVVTLVAIRNRISEDWPLCTDRLLCGIEAFLRPYTSPFAEIDAINPVYEEVTVFCGVSLKEGQQAGEAISDINRNLCRCIAPWNEGQKEPVLGYSFSIRDLVSCIRENPAVEALHGMKLLQVMGEEEKFGLKAYTSEQDENQMIAPSVPWGILVPAVRQYVKLIEPGEWRQDIEFGDLEVENTFVIQ